MKKTVGLITGVLMTAGFLPVIPQEMELLYSYERPCVIYEITASSTAITEQDAYIPSNCFGGNAYISVFKDKNGNQILVEITQQRYRQMGQKGGVQFNPKKNDYLNFFEAFLPKVDALSITASTGGATSGAALSLTYSATTATGDDLITVGVGTCCINVASVTFNGDALTQAIDTSDGFHTSIWYRANPDIATGNVVVTISGATAREISSGVIIFTS